MFLQSRRRTPRSRARFGVAGIVLLGFTLGAQTAPLSSHCVPVAVRSGNHGNPSPVEGIVFRDFVTLPAGTPWLRLCFARTTLSPGSMLRIVSLRDGDVMTLNQRQLEEWSHTSAYFNGNAVMIELIAGPGTTKNQVEIDKVIAGDLPTGITPDTICGPADNRQPAADPRVGRLMPGGCTAWIANVPAVGVDRCHLSAGHCYGPAQVLQFAVPLSAANCGLVHPPASRQFAVDTATSVRADNGPGDDYWVFRCFRNPVTGLTTYEYQGAGIPLAAVMPGPPATLRVTGYGVDGTDTNAAPGGNLSCGCSPPAGTGTWNQTQQDMRGPLVGAPGNTLLYQIDTCGGNSGSPVTDSLAFEAVAIHTHGGCSSPSGNTYNIGTKLAHPGLQAALAQVGSVPGLPGTSHGTATLVLPGLNGPFTNLLASNLWPPTPLSATVSSWHWFYYRTALRRPEALHVFDTCSPARTIDTVLEVFRESAGSLVFMAGNDDACGQGSSLAVDLQPETTYYIRVGGKHGQLGQFDLNLFAPYPAHDDCEGAVPLVHGRNGPFDNLNASDSGRPWSCGGGAGNDLWFVYPVTAANLAVTFSTCDGSTTFDTVLEVMAGECQNAVPLGCNDDAMAPACSMNWQASSVTVFVPSPAPLTVRVGGNNGARGTFAIDVAERPVDDECWQAMPLAGGHNGPFSTAGATISPEPWPCAAAGNDVWFVYTPPCSGQLAISTCSPRRTFDTVVEAFTGACGALASLGCNDDAGGICATGSLLNVAVTASQSVWIRVGGFAGATGVTDVRVDCVPFADECWQAIPVTTGTNGPFSNVLATTSAPAAACGLLGNDVWCTYTATCTAPHTFATCSAARTFDTVLEVLQGDCGAPWSLGCNDDGCDGLGSRLTVPLVQGVVYAIRIGGYAGATGNFELSIEPGTGTGAITTVAPGCGPTTILVEGEPRIGGTVTTTLSNVTGLPFIGLGFGAAVPFCGCTIGHDWASAVFGPMHVLLVPCDPAYIGAPLRIQGADLFGSGGCANPQLTFTATVTATIG
jgi:hypothetical protein